MNQGREKGFTILEVTLFISISALLFVGLISGITVMVDRARFTSSMDGLRTLIRSQYEEVRSGINPRTGVAADVCGSGVTTVAPGSAGCLLIGKIIRFTPDSSTVYVNYVIATTPDSVSASATDSSAIYAASPKYTTIAQEAKEIQWKATFTKFVRQDGVSNTFRAIAILRSPINNTVMIYGVNSTVAAGTVFTSSNTVPNVSSAAIIRNAGRGVSGGAACVNSGGSSANVKTATPFDPDADFSVAEQTNRLKKECSK